MARTYATRDDLIAYTPEGVDVPAEPEVSRLLTRASEAVELLTMSAVYPVDDEGVPTEARHVEAFRTATCAQAAHWLETGDETGTAGQWSAVSIGSINLARAAGVAAGPSQIRTPDAITRPLRLAGLLPGAIVHL